MNLEGHHLELSTLEWIPNTMYTHSWLFKDHASLLPTSNLESLGFPLFSHTQRRICWKKGKRVKSIRQKVWGWGEESVHFLNGRCGAIIDTTTVIVTLLH